MQARLALGGGVKMKVQRAAGPGLAWKLKNALRPSYIWGLLTNGAAKLFSKITHVPTLTAELAGRLVRADGSAVNFGVLSRRCVTTAGAGFLVDDWVAGTLRINNLKYMGCGTGAVAENATDTALGAEVGSRVTATVSEASATQVQAQGTVSYTGSSAITEHGLFSAASSGVLWDRSVFAAVNVANGDSIQFTYTLSVNSGT
jgi:hypothetical protein